MTANNATRTPVLSFDDQFRPMTRKACTSLTRPFCLVSFLFFVCLFFHFLPYFFPLFFLRSALVHLLLCNISPLQSIFLFFLLFPYFFLRIFLLFTDQLYVRVPPPPYFFAFFLVLRVSSSSLRRSRRPPPNPRRRAQQLRLYLLPTNCCQRTTVPATSSPAGASPARPPAESDIRSINRQAMA